MSPRIILASRPLALAATLFAARAAFAVEIGHVDDLLAVNGTASWAGGSQFYDNPGTGGVGGVGDGYLIVRNVNLGNLGSYNSSAEYFGNWTASGATGLSFWLRQSQMSANVQLHLALGTTTNFWQINSGISPTAEWTRFTIDFSNPANWTRIRGSGTFAQALQNVDRILFRHDVSPFTQSPNAIIGDFALDRVMILPAPGAAALTLAGLITSTRRRR